MNPGEVWKNRKKVHKSELRVRNNEPWGFAALISTKNRERGAHNKHSQKNLGVCNGVGLTKQGAVKNVEALRSV